MKKTFLTCIVCLSMVLGQAQINWPVITKTTKPWIRWWWEGSAVNKRDLTWNLDQYQKAGLGGVEITPIYGVYGYEKQFINFLSPQWMEMFGHTLAEAKRLGVGVDLANATGWPFGGPWVTDNDASKTIYFKTYSLNSGEQLKDVIEYNQEALVRTANNKPAAIDTILKPVYLNKNLQSLALDQIQYPGQLPLQCVVAYGEDKKVLDLTGKVDVTGKLNWIAPKTGGKWTLYALFEGLHGKMVERAAPGGEGYAIDHFSATAAHNYFKKFDEAFRGHDISYLRSFFNDSYEVDDARGQANWTPDFFSEFKKRRGYELKEHLPALFGKDDTATNSRVIYDYRSVIDELILGDFTKQWKTWAVSKGKMVRNQSHGSPANTLDLYSVVDIPETEGNDILRFKFATSAANVSGKKLVSSESATWLNEHFLSSLGDVKKAIDLYFLGGVNHIFYHGTAYSPQDAPWPGWLFYAAVHFQPTNPQWKDFHVLNEYIARVQSFLQSSKPNNDVLLYYPIADRYSEPGNALLQHFDGLERNFEKTDFEYISRWMLENGYSFDFFSDRQVMNFIVSENKIVSGGNSYKAILLPNNKFIPLQTMKKLVELAKKGANILFYKELPSGVPGFANFENQQKFLDQIKGQIKWFTPPTIVKTQDSITREVDEDKNLRIGRIGSATFYCSSDLELMLNMSNIENEPIIESDLQFIRRKSKNGNLYFVTNRSDNVIKEWIPFRTHGVCAVIFDPMNGKAGLAKLQKSIHTEPLRVYLQLQPYESLIVQFYSNQPEGNNFSYPELSGQPQEINGRWKIEFLDGGPAIPAKIITSKLVSWTELGGDDLRNFSGTGKYSISFQKPPANPTSWLLDLGNVHETAEVFLNGKKISTLIGPTFQVIIPSSKMKQTNKLEIVVANLMANRIGYMDRNNIPWKIFYNTNMPARKRENVKNGLFDASAWKPLPSGLMGPVRLIPIQ